MCRLVWTGSQLPLADFSVGVKYSMAQTSQLRVDLNSLVQYLGVNQTISLNQIALYYEANEILYQLPPQAQLGSSTVTAVWLARQKYTTVDTWTRAWQSLAEQQRNQGKIIIQGRPALVTAVNLATAQGRRLVTEVQISTADPTVSTVTEQIITTGNPTLVQGPQGAQGVQGPQGVGINSVSVDPQQNLIVSLTSGVSVNAGPVPPSDVQLAVGSTTSVPWGTGSAVSITENALNDYTLDFQLERGEPQTENLNITGSLTVQGQQVAVISDVGRLRRDFTAFGLAF